VADCRSASLPLASRLAGWRERAEFGLDEAMARSVSSFNAVDGARTWYLGSGSEGSVNPLPIDRSELVRVDVAFRFAGGWRAVVFSVACVFSGASLCAAALSARGLEDARPVEDDSGSSMVLYHCLGGTRSCGYPVVVGLLSAGDAKHGRAPFRYH
jgi:hypothetical protein